MIIIFKDKKIFTIHYTQDCDWNLYNNCDNNHNNKYQWYNNIIVKIINPEE